MTSIGVKQHNAAMAVPIMPVPRSVLSLMVGYSFVASLCRLAIARLAVSLTVTGQS